MTVYPPNSKIIKAIVLTHDRSRTITDHMIARYDMLWPEHPFLFYIPYQKLCPTPTSGRIYVQTPVDIKPTILMLLENLDDDEWIYWCIDDKYLIYLDLNFVKKITNWVHTLADTEISGILFCRCRRLLEKDNGNVYLERKGYHQIWIHQFVRVKVLRYLFDRFPDRIPQAKTMDTIKNKVVKPNSHRLFVAKNNHAVFGESTVKGTLTKNCYESIVRNRMSLPEWHSAPSEHEIIMGQIDSMEVNI